MKVSSGLNKDFFAAASEADVLNDLIVIADLDEGAPLRDLESETTRWGLRRMPAQTRETEDIVNGVRVLGAPR